MSMREKCPHCDLNWKELKPIEKGSWIYICRCEVIYDAMFDILSFKLNDDYQFEWDFVIDKCYITYKSSYSGSKEVGWIDPKTSLDRIKKLLIWI